MYINKIKNTKAISLSFLLINLFTLNLFSSCKTRENENNVRTLNQINYGYSSSTEEDTNYQFLNNESNYPTLNVENINTSIELLNKEQEKIANEAFYSFHKPINYEIQYLITDINNITSLSRLSKREIEIIEV